MERDGLSYLVLSDGQLHRRTNADGAVSIIEFQSYAFDLATLRPVDNGDWIRMSERSTSSLMNPDPNDRVYQLRPNQFVEELATRRTDWLYVIAFSLWALVVAGHPRTNRQGTGVAMGLGLAGALVLKAAGFVTLSLVGDNAGYVVFAYALPITAIVFDVWLASRDVNVGELPAVRRTVDALHAVWDAVRRRLPAGPFQGEAQGG